MNERRRQVKVSVEDLLQLKRAERPAPEFWAQFEEQLRAKQLAAIVVKKPWWQSLSGWRGGVAWLSLPVGATAVLALTFLAVRDQRDQPGLVVESEPVASPRTVIADAQASPLELAASPASVVASAASYPSEGESAADKATVSSAGERSRVSELLAWGRGAFQSRDSAELLRGGASVASDLSLTPSAEAELTQGLGRSHGFERGMAGRSATHDPLAAVATPSDTRRARILAALVEEDAYSVQMSASRSRERITNRITEQALYESVSRLSAGGDRLSIKF